MRTCRLKFLLLSLALSLALPARGGEDTVGWMAARLQAGKDILDWELAINKFVSFSDPRVLPVLLKLVDTSEPEGRAEAAGVLWRYDSKEVREKLVSLTQGGPIEVRVEAAKSLCLMKYVASLPVLEEALKATDEKVRSRTLRALAMVKDDKAKAAIETLRSSSSPSDRVWVSYALGLQGVEPDKQVEALERVLLAVPPAAWLPGKADPTEADVEQAAHLGSVRLTERLEAALALSRLESEPALLALARGTGDSAAAEAPNGPRRLLPRHGDLAIVALAHALEDDRPLVRLGCALTARQIHPQTETAQREIEAALAKAMEDKSSLVRQAALGSIAALGLEAQSHAVVTALSHPDPSTRIAAAQAIGSIRKPALLKPLLERLKVETQRSVRRGIFQAIAALRSPEAAEPMLVVVKDLFKERRQNAQAAEELPLAVRAMASAGDQAAEIALKLLPKLKGRRAHLMTDVLAWSGSEKGLDFFIERLREAAPDPDSPPVLFFDSLDARFAPRLQTLIESETAMWIRVILARALYRMGKVEFGRGILWALKNDDPYERKLGAALARDLKMPGSIPLLTRLLSDTPEIAGFAARALLSDGSPAAIKSFLEGLGSNSLRQRRSPPLVKYWEGRPTSQHPVAKDFDNDWVWVVFADNRLGRALDLFLTWCSDGSTWNAPVFTGLTSFADPEGQVPPPTFSLKVRNRDITIAHTATFAQSPDRAKPAFKTLQRVHQFKFQDLFKDKDGDGLPDLEEQALFTNPANPDSDGDGLPDGKDKNPLAKPADLDREEDVLKVLAFSYAYLVKEALPQDARMLVVALAPGGPHIPELPTFPWLVLHLHPEQIRSLWQSSGAGYPQVSFGPTRVMEGNRAVQPLTLIKETNEHQELEVSFSKVDGQWTPTGYREER